MDSSNDEGRAEQRWFAERYAENARFVADLGAPLLDMLAPRPGARILDLGCGDRALTETIAATTSAESAKRNVQFIGYRLRIH